MIYMVNWTLGNINSDLVLIAGILGGLEFLAFRTRKYIKNTMKDEIEPMKKELRTNTLNTLKNTMCNECMPLSERLAAGKEYVEMGGNGGGKIYFHNLEKQAAEKLSKGEKL